MFNKSWSIARVAGIAINVHWSFLILPALIGFSTLASSGLAAAIVSVVFVVAVFACVALHELGHALAARSFGIGTVDITLLPIGGVARLARMPRDPKQELCIALAGPAVNLVIAIFLFGLLVLTGTLAATITVPLVPQALLAQLMLANVALVVFNLLPAFPMDGGRVLRALLAMRMPYRRATKISASIGQAMAMVLGFIGLYLASIVLVLIAVFVFFAARAESAMVQSEGDWWGARQPYVRLPNSDDDVIYIDVPLKRRSDHQSSTGGKSADIQWL